MRSLKYGEIVLLISPVILVAILALSLLLISIRGHAPKPDDQTTSGQVQEFADLERESVVQYEMQIPGSLTPIVTS